MNMKQATLLLALCAVLATGTVRAADDEPGMSVSIIQLVANPDQYHGKKVFLSAFATIEKDNMSLCMAREAASPRDCVWLDIDAGPDQSAEDRKRIAIATKKWQRYHRKLVSVRGTFDKNLTGHLGGWSGAIREIGEIQSR